MSYYIIRWKIFPAKLNILSPCHCYIINNIIFSVLSISSQNWFRDNNHLTLLCTSQRWVACKVWKKNLTTVDFDFTWRLMFVSKVCRQLKSKTQEYTRGRGKKYCRQIERKRIYLRESSWDVFIFSTVRSVCIFCFFYMYRISLLSFVPMCLCVCIYM